MRPPGSPRPTTPPARPQHRPGAWKPIRRLDVFYQDDGEPTRVGGLALDDRNKVHFQYDVAWLSSGRELSPKQLPLDLGRVVEPAPDRHTLHGVFADALPDTWGMRVLDLALRRQGIEPRQAGPLDRLAYLGSRTMGALTFRPATDALPDAGGVPSLEQLAAQAEEVYEGTVEPDSGTSTTLDALERAAGTAGGAQPKVLLSLGADGTSFVVGGEPPTGYTPLLLKFTPRRDGLGLRTDCGAIEEAYARMARDAGIDMPPTRLFQTSDGRWHFAVQRFDRTAAGGRRHVHTLGGMLGRMAGDDGDYDDLLRLTRALTGDARQVEEVLRRLCFNLTVLNDDDHLKNVAFLLDPAEGWRLAPAYDLTYAPSRQGERGMSVAGFESETTWATVEALAERHSIKPGRVRELRAQVGTCVERWPEYAKQAHVPAASIRELADAFRDRRLALDR